MLLAALLGGVGLLALPDSPWGGGFFPGGNGVLCKGAGGAAFSG